MNLRNLTVIGCALVSLTVQPLQAQDADAKLASFFKQYLDGNFRQQPTEATGLGDHRFDGLLEDVSAPAREGWLKLGRDTLARLPQEVDYGRLTRDGQIDFEIFQHELQTEIWLAENTHPFEEDPRTYGSYINDSVYLLLVQSTQPKEVNIGHALERMARIPEVIKAARQNLTHPPKPILETAIAQNRGAISFYETELFQFAGETPQLDKLKSAAVPIVADLKSYQQFLGHYVQLAYAALAPSLIRKVYQSGAYVEGWAVYGEQNMLDMGYGDGDLRLRLMQLKFYLRAVANAILDHKMHCDNFTDDEAMKMLVDDCFQSEGEVRLKIVRAKQSSTQLSTYFVGRMGHYRLRQKVERELGDGFSIGRYHEAVISCGSVPLKYLPELVETRLSQPR